MKISQAVLFPLVVLIGFIFSSQTKAQQEPLRIISSASPYVSQVFDQLTIEIFKRLDVPLSLVKEEAGERAISSANQGIYDGDGLRVADIITPIFPNLIQVPESYIRLNFVAFSKYINIQTDSWDSLSDYDVGYQIGWKVVEKNVKNARAITTVPDGPSLFKMLNFDRVDLVIYVDLEGIGIMKALDIQGVNILQPPLISSDMYLYLHKKHASLVPKIAATLKSMKEDGSYQRILDKVSKAPFEP